MRGHFTYTERFGAVLGGRHDFAGTVGLVDCLVQRVHEHCPRENGRLLAFNRGNRRVALQRGLARSIAGAFTVFIQAVRSIFILRNCVVRRSGGMSGSQFKGI